MDHDQRAPSETNDTSGTSRRGFLTKAVAVVTGTVAGLVPLVSGMVMLFDPLLRRRRTTDKVFVTSLQALPPDGVPRKFNVVADLVNAWNTSHQVPVGAVYLRRTGDREISALNVVCPHAGCFVDLAAESGHFLCPCHNSSFRLDGTIDDPSSPSPRPLDSLEVEIRNGQEIWIQFRNFQPGHKEKIPLV